jgi:hypothetical protein
MFQRTPGSQRNKRKQNQTHESKMAFIGFLLVSFIFPNRDSSKG